MTEVIDNPWLPISGADRNKTQIVSWSGRDAWQKAVWHRDAWYRDSDTELGRYPFKPQPDVFLSITPPAPSARANLVGDSTGSLFGSTDAPKAVPSEDDRNLAHEILGSHCACYAEAWESPTCHAERDAVAEIIRRHATTVGAVDAVAIVERIRNDYEHSELVADATEFDPKTYAAAVKVCDKIIAALRAAETKEPG